MRLFSLEQLKTLSLLHEEGSITRVAYRLGRTQPAVSQQLKKLEEQVSQPLINRHNTPLQLTAAGRRLVDYAQQMLAVNDEAMAYFKGSTISGRIRLGIPSEFATTVLPRIIGQFVKAYPEVTLEVNCDLSRQLLAAQQEHYDLVLALHDKVDRRIKQLIKVDKLVWVASPRLMSQLYQDSAQVLPLVAAPDGCIYRQRALTQLKKAGRACRLVYTIADLQGIAAALEEGLGLTVLAESTVPSHLQVVRHPSLPELGNMGISLVKRSQTTAAVELLAASLAEGL